MTIAGDWQHLAAWTVATVLFIWVAAFHCYPLGEALFRWKDRRDWRNRRRVERCEERCLELFQQGSIAEYRPCEEACE